MKTEPTAIDREAAAIFTPSLEMRVWFDGVCKPWTLRRDVESCHAGPVVAIDTDDFRTVIGMLDQVDDAYEQWIQAASDGWLDIKLSWVRQGREKHMAQWHSGRIGSKTSPGAALVAAMKALRGMK